MTSEIEKAKKAVKRASSALRDIIDRRAEAVRKVEASFRDEIVAEQARLKAANEWLAKAQSDGAEPHPWEGKRVKKRDKLGIMRTRRIGDEFPANTSPPAIGSHYVRLLKADGSEGARFDTWGIFGWELDE